MNVLVLIGCAAAILDFMNVHTAAQWKRSNVGNNESSGAVPKLNFSKTSTCGNVFVQSSRIIGGKTSVRGAWPWQASLFYFNYFICGGVLISPLWVLTAAHCLYARQKHSVIVVLGDYNLYAMDITEKMFDVNQIILHPKYHPTGLNNDIALIKLEKPVSFNNYIQPICLPSVNEKIQYGKVCYVSGWGKPSYRQVFSAKLQQTTLSIVNYTLCWQKNNKITPITDKMFCAAIVKPFLKVNSACHGDSGGGLFCINRGSWKLHGIVNWGSGFCNTTDAYSVFASVSRFRLWIDKYVKINGKIIFTV